MTLAHDTPEGEGPEGAGLYSAIDDVSFEATSFPQQDRLSASIDTDGAAESQECVR